ncbi:MAG: Xaa-Pro peptidase family protein [Pseudomonadota bacterium]
MQPEQSPPAGRLQRIRERLPLWSVQALLFLDMKNIRYLTGFTGSDGALYVGPDCRVLLVDGRYITQARGEAGGFEVHQYQNKMDGLVDVISRHGCRIVGFEAETMTVATWTAVKERLPGLTFRPLQEELETLRAVKDEEEIARIREAAVIASQALHVVLERVKPGMTEREIAADLDDAIRRGGAQEVSFPTIVASGANSALPHARPQDRMVRPGDLLTIDFGAVFEGYHSDETCTFALGRADAKQEQVYQVVKEAHDRAIRAVRAGVSCQAIDSAARSWIEAQGLSKAFTHGTGHGVGLDVHEYPRLAPQSQAVLEAGMVVTVEPGVYLPDLWGVRIEDLVVVRRDGCAMLSKISKEFSIIEI